jgi:hypothetical protein
MRGLPKFLLPCDPDGTTLIERHVYSLLAVSEKIWIPTRSDFIGLLESLNLPKGQVVLLSMKTQSMIETVANVVGISGSERFVVGMPDTYFHGGDPYPILSESKDIACLALWKIREDQKGKLGQVKIDLSSGAVIDVQDKKPDCEYELSWGAMSFSRDGFDYADDKMTTIGDLIPRLIQAEFTVRGERIHGKYFDCGTPLEYYSMLSHTRY